MRSHAKALDEVFVCADCFSDEGLKEYVENEATELTCTFCSAESEDPIAAPVTKVAGYINERLYEEFDLAENCLSWDNEDKKFMGETWTTYELLADVVGLDLPNDDGSLFDAIGSEVDDNTWCRKHPYSLDNVEEAQWSWELFCRIVKHERRFFFLDSKDEHDEVLSPKELLEKILDDAEKVGLLIAYAPGALTLHRVRFQEPSARYVTPADLGPPPEAKQSNRMSPAGVVMFYANDTVETALRETASSRGPGTYAVATFVATRPLVVLNLAQLPPIPSIFEQVSDTLEYDPRKTLQFLPEVAIAISQLVPRDGREHVEYVPTQVVTEFVRSRQQNPIDGIQYTSAVDGGNSFVLFADQSNLVPIAGATEEEQWLRLEGRAERVVSQADIEGWRPVADFS